MMSSVILILTFVFLEFLRTADNSVDPFSNLQTLSDIDTINAYGWPFIKPVFPFSIDSPCDVDTTRAIPMILEPIVIHLRWYIPEEGVNIKNTGYYMEVELPDDINRKPWLTGGPVMDDVFLMQQMHYHWGERDNCGSEHRLNGIYHSMEAHIVFYNSKYENYKKATEFPDGVAVVAFFGDASDVDNPDFDDLVNKISEVKEPESETTGTFKKEFKYVYNLFQRDSPYYSFPGTLTTAPFSKCVTWILFTSPFNISHRQLAEFRKLKSKDHRTLITQNDRELHPFGKRPIIISQ